MLKLKIGAKVMLTVNIDVQDRLTDGQTGNIRHTEFTQGSLCKVHVNNSNEQAGFEAMRLCYLGRQS